MDASYINDWSEVEKDGKLMDAASIFAKILESQNECGRSFDEHGLPFLEKYGIQNAVKLQFDIRKNPRSYSVTTCLSFLFGRARPFPKTLTGFINLSDETCSSNTRLSTSLDTTVPFSTIW